MTQKSFTLHRWTAIAVCALWSVTATTAQVSVQPRGGYQRVNFTFSKPARLAVSSSDSSIVLKFSAPIEKSPAQISAMLKGIATKASLSADGKTLTISTTQRYRTRHFVSGNTVGLDIIGAQDDAEPKQVAAQKEEKIAAAPEALMGDEATEEAAEEILSTKKPVAQKPQTKKAEKPEKKPAPAKKDVAAAKPASKPQPTAPQTKAETPAAATAATPPAEAMLTTKQPEPAPAPAKEEPAKPAPAAKPAEQAAAPAPAETKPEAQPQPKPEPAKPLAEPPAAAEKAAEAAKKAEANAPETEIAQPTPRGPFMVTARSNSEGTTLNFPYSARTAAAVFERKGAIWIIFSRAADANAERLKTVLPKSITDVKQYNYPDHTVLRLATDGTVHASARTNKGTYAWDIRLAGEAMPVRDIAVNIDTIDDKRRLLLGAFDVDAPVKFYDPATGEMLLVVPSYEGGLGINNTRQYPSFSLLSTAQGIAVASAQDDIVTHLTRLGVSLESPQGLPISKDLGILGESGAPVAGLASGVMLPYELWHVPVAKFKETLLARQETLDHSTKENRAENLLALATLYLGHGFGAEALGYLNLLEANEPEFYKSRRLALLAVAAHALMNHTDEAAQALAAPELADLPEAALWREYLTMLAPRANAIQQLQKATEQQAQPKPAEGQAQTAAAVPAATPAPAANTADGDSEAPEEANAQQPAAPLTQPQLRFLKYNMPYIRFYPPKIRQMLASAAADGYIANGLQEKAVTTFDTLSRDGILDPVRRQAEYAVAMVAAKNKKFSQAEDMLARLEAQNEDPRTKARARVSHIMLQMALGKKTPAEGAEALEAVRITWRGDTLEREVLKSLASIYKNEKQYDEALRTYKTLSDEFPDDPDFIATSGAMTDLFEQLYVKGMADEMPPLKALSLFYEFRDLTPVGEKGDFIIQRLADRLAAFDLLDRAAQLLENQITYRAGGEDRSRIGARLSLLYLLNHQPQEALKVIEVTNYGGNSPELQRQRMQLAAQALTGMKRHEEALNMLYNDVSPEGELLKLDILWAAQDWPNVINKAEEILSKRSDLTAPLTPTETEVLLKLALGYSFEGDYTQLRYLRDYYSALLADSGYKQIFDFITNDTNPLDREDSTMLGEQINRTESFLGLFRDKIAQGKLSEAIK